jgi:hypothetical protein
MSDTVRRFRSLAIAFVVLAISAGAAFAAAPVLRPASSPVAATQAEEPEANENEPGEDSEQGEDEDVNEPEDAPEAPDSEEGTPAEGTHGELVSTAAEMETPEGFANHGAFVSCVAKMKDVALADVDWATVTPEACAAAKEAAKATRDAAKAERDAAKAERQAQRDANVKGKSAEKRAEHAAGH